ncbi:MAG: DUF5691 domain-containing protein [bacterium]
MSTQALWEEWVKIALLGTKHQTRPPTINQLPADLAATVQALYPTAQIPQDHQREQHYLALTAVLNNYQQAGYHPAALADFEQSPLTSSTTVTATSEKYLSEDIMALFRRILALSRPSYFLKIWADYSQQCQQVVPPSDLLNLLDAAKTHESLRPYLHDLLGSRGLWLIRFREDWQKLLTTTNTTLSTKVLNKAVWEEGTLGERYYYLQQLRNDQPAQAREQLQAIWRQENAKTRAHLLAALHINLSLDDETFLESCLDDRAKSVKSLARQLLAQLEQSAFVQRQQQRLARWLIIEPDEKRSTRSKAPKFRIVVDLSVEWDDAASLLRDGIENTSRSGKGRKASWLEQALSYVPVNYWQTHWQQSPDDLLKALHKHDWENNIIAGWEKSIESLGCNSDWAQAFVQRRNDLQHPAWQYLTDEQRELAHFAYFQKHQKGKVFWKYLSHLNALPTNAAAMPCNDTLWDMILSKLEDYYQQEQKPTHYTHYHALEDALAHLFGQQLPFALLARYRRLLQQLLQDEDWSGFVPNHALEIIQIREEIHHVFQHN